MVSPQKEHGHLDIANELVDQFTKLNLPKYEWRVLWAILRKTWSWHRKSDSVPLSQIVEMTGLHQPHVSRAKASLLKKRLLFEQAGKIGFQKDYELWNVKGFTYTNSGMNGYTDSGIKRAKTYTDSGCKYTNSGIKSIPKLGDSKEKKETIQKKRRAHTQKRKPRKAKKFISPKVAEVKAYAESRGYPNFDAEYFIEYYAVNDWHDKKGDPVLNWKQKMLSVWLKDKDKPENVADVLGCGPCDEEDARRTLKQAGLLKDQP